MEIEVVEDCLRIDRAAGERDRVGPVREGRELADSGPTQAVRRETVAGEAQAGSVEIDPERREAAVQSRQSRVGIAEQTFEQRARSLARERGAKGGIGAARPPGQHQQCPLGHDEAQIRPLCIEIEARAVYPQ